MQIIGCLLSNFYLNMFRASLCPSSGEKRLCTTAYSVLHWLYWVWLCEAGPSSTQPHPAQAEPSSTQPQPAQPVQNTICGSTQSCSPDNGHNDARNMLRQKFDNKHQISCILLVSLSSPQLTSFTPDNIGSYKAVKR